MSGAEAYLEIRKHLNRHGRRMTPQRGAILEELRGRTDHPTAEQLHVAVQDRIPRISLGTVYRNLQVLVEEGYALRLPGRGGTNRFDGQVEGHHHIVCRDCGRMDDVYVDTDHKLLNRVARATGFRVISHRTEFEGLCPDCGRADRN